MTAPKPVFRVGLIGSSIQQSKSPALHETEARALGLDLAYRLIDLKALGVGVKALPQLLATSEAEGLAGVNITHPCKQAVLPLLDELSEDAAMIGAVNTVVFRDGRRLGYNTDEWGFREGFKRQMAGAPLGKVVQIGAGGAGAATAHAMLILGAGAVSLFDVDPVRAQILADKLGVRFGRDRVMATPDLAASIIHADGLVHATPVGMADHPGLPLDAALLRPDLWVAEVVYFPLETPLLAEARKIGARTIDGGRMVVFQAARAFELFTGVQPDAERMLQHFLSQFAASGELSS
jgi:shikimate dehydrogenase